MKRLLLLSIILSFIISGCSRYEDKGEQSPGNIVPTRYAARFDKWTGDTEYNINSEWMTLAEYKTTSEYIDYIEGQKTPEEIIDELIEALPKLPKLKKKLNK